MCIKNNSVSANQCFEPANHLHPNCNYFNWEDLKMLQIRRTGWRIVLCFNGFCNFCSFKSYVCVCAFNRVCVCVCAFLLFIVFMCLYVCVVALNRVCVRMFVLLFLILCFYVGAESHFFWSLLKMSNQTQSLSAVPVC
jgi:hypothetical protein